MARKTADTKATAPTKKSRISQTDIPRYSLAESLKIAQGLVDDCAGGPAAPYLVAMALGLSPSSSYFRDLSGSSIAYGLTEGGYNAESIALTPLGRRAVAPTTEEGDDLAAQTEAALRPRILRTFFEKYHRNKFPAEKIAENVLVEIGVPRDRVSEVMKLIRVNGEYTGIIRHIKTGLFVAIEGAAEVNGDETIGPEPPEVLSNADQESISIGPADNGHNSPLAAHKPATNRVFISHGRNRAITEQVKEIITFGKFVPVVSVEKESMAVPVPDKVFEDMRSCTAGVIHVMSEGELLDPQGNKVRRLNENVLIEIGAAIALFKRSFVLLVEKGVSLPSNLQGLYRCEYEGEKLDYDATMKLLKTFNEFGLE